IWLSTKRGEVQDTRTHTRSLTHSSSHTPTYMTQTLSICVRSFGARGKRCQDKEMRLAIANCAFRHVAICSAKLSQIGLCGAARPPPASANQAISWNGGIIPFLA